MSKVKWQTVEDEKVKSLWVCPECKQKAYIHPDWYSNNGTPMCTECDADMEYVKTEICH